MASMNFASSRLERVTKYMSSSTWARQIAAKTAMVKYHRVCSIVPATRTIARISATIRNTMPARKRSEAIFLHPAIERGSSQSQRGRRATDVVRMPLQRPDDRCFLHGVETGCLLMNVAGHVPGGRRRREVGIAEDVAFTENHRPLDGVTQRADIAGP